MDPADLTDVLTAVRKFVRDDVVPLEEQIDAEDAIPDHIIATCKEMGLYGFAIPEEYGGLGMSMVEEVQLAFELGWTTPALRSLFGTNNGIAGQVLITGGTEEQRRAWLPRLALTHGAAMATGPELPPHQAAVNWAIRDTMPKWAKQLIQHKDPNIVERTARRAVVWAVLNGMHVAQGEMPEIRQARARVAGGTTVPHTMPTYVPGTDPELTRAEVEREFAL